MTDIIYCDRCGIRIDRQPSFEHQDINLCPECAAKLYQKIYGNQENEQ